MEMYPDLTNIGYEVELEAAAETGRVQGETETVKKIAETQEVDVLQENHAAGAQPETIHPAAVGQWKGKRDLDELKHSAGQVSGLLPGKKLFSL
jgi:hypothetical protein